MSWPDFIDGALSRAMSRLLLPAAAEDVLRAFVAMCLDPEAAEAAQSADVYGREGVIAWSAVAAGVPEELGIEEVEAAVDALAAWGLVEVLGAEREDPVTAGVAALRLSHAGRACLGLAPAGRRAHEEPEPESAPWIVLHGASREAVLLEAPSSAVIVQPARQGPSLRGLCGEVALALCTAGAVVVDGFGLSETDRGLLEALLLRLPRARGVLLLALPDPGPVRLAAARTGATLRWVEPLLEARRGERALDRRLGALLTETSLTDRVGVPDSDLAALQRSQVAWLDVLLTPPVRWQLEQARLHAEHRLRAVPSNGYRLLLSGPPGTGKTMAAEALAGALNRPLVKLDLSSVLSKWLGETEKFLSHVFEVAEAAGAVLILDEAEALLRQRESGAQASGLQTTVAWLLTRLERHPGAVVATTNRTRELDEAFFRRFDDYIVLLIPDAQTRRLLWAQALPAAGPAVDLDLLAERFAVGGALIRGAVLRARAWAEGMERPLDTALILASLGRELEKSDRSSKDVLVEPYTAEVGRILRGEGTCL